MIALDRLIGGRDGRDTNSAAGLGMGNFLWREALQPHASTRSHIRLAKRLQTARDECVETLSIADLARIADGYAGRYSAMGVTRQDPVGVYVPDGVEYLLHFLALSRLGAIPVFVNAAMDIQTAVSYLHHVGVTGVFTDEVRRAQLSGIGGLAADFCIVEDDFANVRPQEYVPFEHDKHDPVLITHSSGTTGIPKAVVLQHEPFFYPVARECEHPVDPATKRVLMALPPSHNSAISAAAMAILTGRELIVAADIDGQSVVAAIKAHEPTAVIAFPQTFVSLLALRPEAGSLRSVQMWINLGDAAHERHIRELQRFGHHEVQGVRLSGSQFVDGLGSSEMGVMLFSIVHSPYSRDYQRCVGPPRAWVNVAILNSRGEQLPEGVPGLLGVKGPCITVGYWNDSKLTFKSRLNGYWLTGDIAVRDQRGYVRHLDRVTDAVETSCGTFFTLVYEELILNGVEEVLDCAVVAISRPSYGVYSVCFAVLRPGCQACEASIAERIGTICTLKDMPNINGVKIIRRDELPVGITGKVLKNRLREIVYQWLSAESPVGPRSSAGGSEAQR